MKNANLKSGVGGGQFNTKVGGVFGLRKRSATNTAARTGNFRTRVGQNGSRIDALRRQLNRARGANTAQRQVNNARTAANRAARG